MWLSWLVQKTWAENIDKSIIISNYEYERLKSENLKNVNAKNHKRIN